MKYLSYNVVISEEDVEILREAIGDPDTYKVDCWLDDSDRIITEICDQICGWNSQKQKKNREDWKNFEELEGSL